MDNRKNGLLISMLAGTLLLSACGGGDNASAVDSEAANVQLPNGMTVAEQIEARQGQLKKLGSAFKTISDQSKAGEPDLAAIQSAAASAVAETATMKDWFPAGTGPESGVETDALPAIWESPEDFNAKIDDFRAAAAQLKTAADGGDLETITAAFRATGGSCKACHDKYRLDD